MRQAYESDLLIGPSSSDPGGGKLTSGVLPLPSYPLATNPLRRSVAAAPEGHGCWKGAQDAIRGLRSTTIMIPSMLLAFGVEHAPEPGEGSHRTRTHMDPTRKRVNGKANSPP
jgi:hypothetical protein